MPRHGRVRVLFLVDGDRNEPSARFRIYQVVPSLEAAGFSCVILAAGQRRGLKGRALLLRHVFWADVVVLQRVLPPRPLLALLRRLNPAIVFDFDDAIYELEERRARFAAVLASAREVVAGNRALGRRAAQMTRSVSVIPVVVDERAYLPWTGSHDGGTRLVWIGTAGNLAALELLEPTLRELSRRGHRFELCVISTAAPRWPGVNVVHHHWTPDGAPRALAQMDIGVAPLPAVPWSEGKCGLKVVEYMAAGLPVVATPLGGLREIVVDGETGFLAEDPGDWLARLEQLLNDPAMRRELGQNGRRRLEQHYSLRLASEALAEVLRRVAASARNSTA